MNALERERLARLRLDEGLGEKVLLVRNGERQAFGGVRDETERGADA